MDQLPVLRKMESLRAVSLRLPHSWKVRTIISLKFTLLSWWVSWQALVGVGAKKNASLLSCWFG